MTRAARPTVVGMSCSFRSRKTRYPRRSGPRPPRARPRRTAPGPPWPRRTRAAAAGQAQRHHQIVDVERQAAELGHRGVPSVGSGRRWHEGAGRPSGGSPAVRAATAAVRRRRVPGRCVGRSVRDSGGPVARRGGRRRRRCVRTVARRDAGESLRRRTEAVHGTHQIAHIGDVVPAGTNALRPANTRAGARGSRKVAVPTSTASAPAINNSTTSTPRPTPPDADDAGARKGGAAVVHGPHRHRADGRARQPAARRARAEPVRARAARRWPCPARCSRARAPRPRRQRGAGDVDDVGHVRAELHPQRQPAARPTPPRRAAVACAEWANMRLRSSRFGQLTLTSTATTPGAPASSAAARRVVLDAPAPDAGHHPRPAVDRGRELVGQPRRHARVPAARPS